MKNSDLEKKPLYPVDLLTDLIVWLLEWCSLDERLSVLIKVSLPDRLLDVDL